jgi:hypothetical protein
MSEQSDRHDDVVRASEHDELRLLRAIRHEQAGQSAVVDSLVHTMAVLHGRLRGVDDQLHALVLEQSRESALLDRILARLPRPRPAVGIAVVLKPRGEDMDITLDVDVTGERVVGQFVDDKGDVTPTGPNGPDGVPAVISYDSSDTTVVTTSSAGDLSFLKAGSAVLTATALDTSGAAVPGFTGSVNLTLTPGVAAALQVSVEGAPPVPAPEPTPSV